MSRRPIIPSIEPGEIEYLLANLEKIMDQFINSTCSARVRLKSSSYHVNCSERPSSLFVSAGIISRHRDGIHIFLCRKHSRGADRIRINDLKREKILDSLRSLSIITI